MNLIGQISEIKRKGRAECVFESKKVKKFGVFGMQGQGLELLHNWRLKAKKFLKNNSPWGFRWWEHYGAKIFELKSLKNGENGIFTLKIREKSTKNS